MDRFALPGAAYDRAYELGEQAAESSEAREMIEEAAETQVQAANNDGEPWTDACELWSEVRSDIGGFEIEDTGCDIRDIFEEDDAEAIEICRKVMAA